MVSLIRIEIDPKPPKSAPKQPRRPPEASGGPEMTPGVYIKKASVAQVYFFVVVEICCVFGHVLVTKTQKSSKQYMGVVLKPPPHP
jgi:hypothetical protein